MRTMILCGALSIVAATLASGQAAQRYTVAGDNVVVYNLVGQVRVEGAPAGGLVVEVTRGGADASKLAIQTDPIGGRSTFRVIYPDDDIVYPVMGRHSSTTLDVRDDGTFSGDEHRFGGRGHRVRISGDGSGTEAYADLRILVPPGQRIAVYLAVGKMTATNVNGDLTLDVSSSDVTASGIHGSLMVDAGSGDVRVTDATGDLNLDTGSGNVVVSRAQGDELLIDTGSGDVTLDHAEARSLKIDTGSGNADATAVRSQDLSIETGSGDVTLELVAGGGTIDINTGSGQVNVTLPGDYGASVLLDTGSGEIDLGGIPVTVTKLQEDHVEGRIGDGKARLHIETGSGDVRLKKA
jgi:lia operon protein LiaG